MTSPVCPATSPWRTSPPTSRRFTIWEHLVCEDRAECIRRAILDHPEPHVILLTGKGEETTMKRGREFVPFPSDVELTLKYLAEYDEKEAKA